jgi:hypothetical protein
MNPVSQLTQKIAALVSLAPSREPAPAVGLRARIVCGILVGACAGLMAWRGLTVSGSGARDFGFALREAEALVHHRLPYGDAVGFDLVLYPLTAALFALPFAGFSPPVAGAVFAGVSAGLLAFAMVRNGWNRLLIFLSYPYWSAVITVQWSPLLMAAACLPWLFPVAIAKPNLGLPVALRSATPAGLGIAALLTVITIVWVPGWPAIWWHGLAGYQSFLPVASGAGCLLVLALARYRDKDSRFLLLMGMIPQRWFYDALLLWLIPATTVELAAAGLASWGAMLFTPETRTIRQVALLSVTFNYLPMLAIVLTRPWRHGSSEASGPSQGVR